MGCSTVMLIMLIWGTFLGVLIWVALKVGFVPF